MVLFASGTGELSYGYFVSHHLIMLPILQYISYLSPSSFLTVAAYSHALARHGEVKVIFQAQSLKRKTQNLIFIDLHGALWLGDLS